MREPLNYRITRQRGSHRTLTSPGRRPVRFAFHDRVELSPGIVENYLVEQVGLSRDEALALLRGR